MGEVMSIARVAQVLDLSTQTLQNWYKWYEDESYVKPQELKLPPYKILDKRGTRFFDVNDIPKLLDFKEKLQGEYKGIMAQYNAEKHWGSKRGQAILQRKAEKENEQKKPE